MKILFNCLNLKKGGAERVISTLANNFINDNDVTILTIMNMEDSYELNPKVKRIKIDKQNSYSSNKIKKIFKKMSINRLTKLKREIINENPDIIISFLPEPSFRLMFVRKFSKKLKQIPVIISIRNDPNVEYKNSIVRNIMKKLYKNVDGMVFQTKLALNYFNDILPRKVKKIIIPNPIGDEFINRKYKYNKASKTFVTVGRLEPQKNHIMLINSFINFCKDNNDYELKIYGDGNLRSQLQEYIKEHGFENKILLMGTSNNIGDELEKARCFVLSSNYEGMPNALIEALCLGIPSISTNVSGVSDLIEDNVNGLIVNTNDSVDMAQKMNKIISEEHFIEGAKEYSMKLKNGLDLKNVAAEWLNFLKGILNENNKRK